MPAAPKFRTNANGSAICAHRDLSVCTPCLSAAADRAVIVYGEVYICESVSLAAELRRVLSEV